MFKPTVNKLGKTRILGSGRKWIIFGPLGSPIEPGIDGRLLIEMDALTGSRALSRFESGGGRGGFEYSADLTSGESGLLAIFSASIGGDGGGDAIADGSPWW